MIHLAIWRMKILNSVSHHSLKKCQRVARKHHHPGNSNKHVFALINHPHDEVVMHKLRTCHCGMTICYTNLLYFICRAVRGKMKRSISRELKRKRIKREPRPVLEPTRSSSRVRKTVLPPPVEVKKILKVSLERILPVKKPQKVRPYKCTSCTKSFLTSDTLTYHIGRIHSGIPCPTCDAKFSSIKEKDAHMTRVHNIAPYACSLCGNKFYKASRLQVHLFTRHEDGEKKFSCAKCDRSFALEQNFERHVKFHELDGIKPIVCDVCDCRFKDEETRDTHKATHIPKYQCDHCGKRCQSKQMLARSLLLIFNFGVHTTVFF